MSFVNFRKTQPETRFKMRLRNAEMLQKLEDAEPKNSKPIWIKISDWRGCLDHLAPEKPTGAGQIFRC